MYQRFKRPQPVETREEDGEERRRRPEDALALVVDEPDAFGEVSGVSERDVRVVHEPGAVAQRGGAEDERDADRQEELARPERGRTAGRPGRREGRVNARRSDNPCYRPRLCLERECAAHGHDAHATA